MSNKLQLTLIICFSLGILIFSWAIFNIDRLNISSKRETTKNIFPTPTNAPNATQTQVIKEKIEDTSEVPTILANINAYLKTKNVPAIPRASVSRISNKTVLQHLQYKKKNFIVIDIREKYEQSRVKLSYFPNIHYIRLGDLINNKFSGIDKNTEVVIASFTENREIAAASYLLSQGFINVKILQGGLLLWSTDGLPLAVNTYEFNDIGKNDISSVLKPYTESEIKQVSSSMILTFGNYSPTNVSMLVKDSETLTKYINALDPKKKYILSCEKSSADESCWEALYFSYIAKNSITILGYIVR
jgi:rhodanese-related sulfurtransferase